MTTDTIGKLTEAQNKLKQLQKQKDNLASDILTRSSVKTLRLLNGLA